MKTDDEIVERPYNQTDHYHCWQSKKPPCGQKIEHLKCCLCELPNPIVTQQRKEILEAIREKIDGQTHTPIDSNAYLEAVRKAKAPFDDGFNHGRECAYEHVESILQTLQKEV